MNGNAETVQSQSKKNDHTVSAPSEALDYCVYDVSISHIGREVIGRTLQAPDRTYLQSCQASFGQCNALNTPALRRSTSLSGVWMQLYYFTV